jgi:mono/diheme cytochrome c family protein
MSNEPTTPLSSAMDEAEPTAGRGAAPVLLIAVFAVLVFLGMLYLDSRAGGFDAHVYAPYADYEVLKAKQPVPAGGEQILQGKLVFATCSACHQMDGKGSSALHAPPLAGSDWVQAEGPNRIIRIVLNGLGGPITVSGGQYGEGTMPAFKDAFTDDQIAAVLSYVRQEWGNKGGPVKPEQVKAIRTKIASKTDSWNATDLLQVPDKD